MDKMIVSQNDTFIYHFNRYFQSIDFEAVHLLNADSHLVTQCCKW